MTDNYTESPQFRKERPILFSGAMVRAILEGRKTQTRRVLSDQKATLATGVFPGIRLWVRESWAHDAPDLETLRAKVEDAIPDHTYGPYYRATESAPDTLKWRPSIHMPRWASRITLEVKAVKAERLHAISRADVLAEGVPVEQIEKWERWLHMQDCHGSAFGELWDSVHGKGAWALNPWVTAVTFERVAA